MERALSISWLWPLGMWTLDTARGFMRKVREQREEGWAYCTHRTVLYRYMIEI